MSRCYEQKTNLKDILSSNLDIEAEKTSRSKDRLKNAPIKFILENVRLNEPK